MSNPDILKQKFSAIDGTDSPGYQSIKGTYDFNLFKLIIQQMPKDSNASLHTPIYIIQIQLNDKCILGFTINIKIQIVDMLKKTVRTMCSSGCVKWMKSPINWLYCAGLWHTK